MFGLRRFFDTFMAGEARPELLTEIAGAPLRLIDPGIGFKPFPCNNFTHRAIDAALQLREKFSISQTQIDSVRVTFPDLEYVNRPQPRSGTEARFSVQYTTLAALLDGEVNLDSFSDERLHAADMVTLLPKVQMLPDVVELLDLARHG